MRRTKPLAVLTAALAGTPAYAAIVGASGTVSVTEASSAAAANTGNFTGLNNNTQMSIPFDVTTKSPFGSDTITVTAGWNNAVPTGSDFNLFTGAIIISMNASGFYNVQITSLTLSDGMSATAVFTFGGGLQLNFTNDTTNMYPGNAGFTPVTTNALTGTGSTGAYSTSGGFVFGSTTITTIQLTFAVTQTAASAKNETVGFQFDAITLNSVPEPSTLALFGGGSAFAAAWVAARRRKAKAARTTKS